MKKILFAIAFAALLTGCDYDNTPYANTALECRQQTLLLRTEAQCLRDLVQRLQTEIVLGKTNEIMKPETKTNFG